MTLTAHRWPAAALALAGLALAMGAHAQAPAAPAAAAAASAPAASKPARKSSAASMGCSVAEFRTLSYDTHVPTERADLAMQWLRSQGPRCTEEQILTIRANRALWLGVADTVAIMGWVDRLVEVVQAGRPELLQSMYASTVPDRGASMEVLRVNGGTRPVVPPPPAAPPMVMGVQVPPPAPPMAPPPRPPYMPPQ
ncbi:MAG: hypothetical protein RL559_706 [Pseudomonadota bacterium]